MLGSLSFPLAHWALVTVLLLRQMGKSGHGDRVDASPFPIGEPAPSPPLGLLEPLAGPTSEARMSWPRPQSSSLPGHPECSRGIISTSGSGNTTARNLAGDKPTGHSVSGRCNRGIQGDVTERRVDSMGSTSVWPEKTKVNLKLAGDFQSSAGRRAAGRLCWWREFPSSLPAAEAGFPPPLDETRPQPRRQCPDGGARTFRYLTCTLNLEPALGEEPGSFPEGMSGKHPRNNCFAKFT